MNQSTNNLTNVQAKNNQMREAGNSSLFLKNNSSNKKAKNQNHSTRQNYSTRQQNTESTLPYVYEKYKQKV